MFCNTMFAHLVLVYFVQSEVVKRLQFIINQQSVKSVSEILVSIFKCLLGLNYLQTFTGKLVVNH
jgi:hypothetical protein